jgi:hypothetical protein
MVKLVLYINIISVGKNVLCVYDKLCYSKALFYIVFQVSVDNIYVIEYQGEKSPIVTLSIEDQIINVTNGHQQKIGFYEVKAASGVIDNKIGYLLFLFNFSFFYFF